MTTVTAAVTVAKGIIRARSSGRADAVLAALLDRAFDAKRLLRRGPCHRGGAAGPAKSTRNPRVLQHLPDGSYASCLDGLVVRIIDADVAMTGAYGSWTADPLPADYTLTDHNQYPVVALVRLYRERREIETTYLGLATRCKMPTCCARATSPA